MTAKEEAQQMYGKHGFEHAIALAYEYSAFEQKLGAGWIISLHYLSDKHFLKAEYYLEVAREIRALHEADKTKEIYDLTDMD